MPRFYRSIFMLSLLGIAASCSFPDTRQVDSVSRGAPERHLDVSSEVVNLGLRSGKEVDDLAQWINRDQPTRAELYCAEGERNCNDAKQVLDLYGVPVTFINSQAGTATLVYERILARDCDPRFRDDHRLWYNESYVGFGCSVSSNLVQHVTQKQQFISPNLSDFRDAEAAVTSYGRYQQTSGAGLKDSSAAEQGSVLSTVGN